MAVYTEVRFEQADALCRRLGLGPLTALQPIRSGIENTNYYATTERGHRRFVIGGEFAAHLGLKVQEWLSIDYSFSAVKQPLLVDRWQIDVRASLGAERPVLLLGTLAADRAWLRGRRWGGCAGHGS